MKNGEQGTDNYFWFLVFASSLQYCVLPFFKCTDESTESWLFNAVIFLAQITVDFCYRTAASCGLRSHRNRTE